VHGSCDSPHLEHRVLMDSVVVDRVVDGSAAEIGELPRVQRIAQRS